MILVDSNVWSELLKQQRHEPVVTWLSANSEDIVLSSIVLAELRFFVAKQPAGKRRRQMAMVLGAIDAGVGARFADFGDRDAVAYGDLMAAMRRAGTPVRAIDGLIAAQALCRGYALATRNVEDFRPTGVEVINPWDSSALG
jgi:predicted nucleic acid-binding protein